MMDRPPTSKCTILNRCQHSFTFLKACTDKQRHSAKEGAKEAAELLTLDYICLENRTTIAGHYMNYEASGNVRFILLSPEKESG